MKTYVVASVIALFTISAAAFAEPVAADIAQSHPNGTSITIRSIEISDTELRLDVRIVNSLGDDVRLASQPRRTYAEASEDNRLMLVPPEDNEFLEIPARSTVEGSLIFMGSVPDSGEMTVVFNETGNMGPQSPTPRLDIVLPAELIEAAVLKKN